jgi:DNA repair exonuclease SbcCD ATPase subunit
MAGLGANADLINAYVAALREQEAAFEEVGGVVGNIDLVIRELELLGKSEEALALTRQKELAGLNEIDRAIMERIYALEDEQAALEKTQSAIQSYVDALLSIQDKLAATRNDIEEFGMDPREIYKRRKVEADRLMDALGEMTDPQQIQDTVDRINSLITEGWGVLEDSQKKWLQKSFLNYLDEVARLAEERIAVGLAPHLGDEEVSLEGAMADLAKVMSDLDGSLASSTEGMEKASAEQLEAAKAMMSAVTAMNDAIGRMPSTIEVRVKNTEVN